MKVEITQVRPRTGRYDRPFNGCKVYVDCTLSGLIDRGFFSEHKIYNLQFKCKAWNKLKGSVTKIVREALIDAIPGAEKVGYSKNCGCSCGCSPGYNVRGPLKEYWNSDVWCKLTPSEEEVRQIADKMDELDSALEKEISEWELEQLKRPVAQR